MSRILIIEDEEAIADLEKDYLELSDFQVHIENSGDTGLAAALASPFLIFALLIDGPLPHRLLGAAALLLAPVFVLYSYRWAAYAVGLLIALSQRREERKRGEEEDAKRY